MNKPTKLSICIPTYNFGHLIGQTLASIVPQLVEGVEIVVLDGGSTDETSRVMEEWTRRCPAIRYVRQNDRGGIDADIARVVELADGQYCWLFSADDLMVPDALSIVREQLVAKPDVLVLVHSTCTFDMQVVRPAYPVLASGERQFDLGQPADRREYLTAARSSEAFFSFLSGLVVRRSVWGPTRPVDGFFYGSCWGHAARLMTIMRDEGLTVRFHATPIVHRRGDNDSFRDRGVIARFALAIEGYQRIVSSIFGQDSAEMVHVKRVLASEFRLTALLDGKAAWYRDPATEDRARLDAMIADVHHVGWRGRATRFIYALAPGPLLGPAMKLKAQFGRWRAGVRA